MKWKLMEFQTTVQNYNWKSSVEPEIFPIFQHKVEQILHFNDMRHIYWTTYEHEHEQQMKDKHIIS